MSILPHVPVRERDPGVNDAGPVCVSGNPNITAAALAQRADLHLDLTDTVLTELAVKTSRVEALMNAWRTKDGRYGRIEACKWLAQLLLWPSCFVFIVLVVAGLSGPWAWIPLALIALAVVHDELLDWADRSVAGAWEALVEATNLSDEDLVYLVQGIGNRQVAR